jgi:L-ascorbate metabolism protein UlaG (beta-lactamase superfamily)
MGFIHFLGHAGFEVGIGQQVVIIDPFFGTGLNEPCEIPLLKPSLIKRADVILLTHEHWDHCDPAAVKSIAERTGAIVIAPSKTLELIDIDEKKKIDVSIGDSFTVKGLDITVTKAIHPASVYPVGYIVRVPETFSFYHAGDTYQFNEMMNINVDYAFLPIGGTYTMDPIDAANATKLLRAKFIIPMHYNTFSRIKQDVEDFKRRTRGRTLVLQPDQTIEV